MIISSPDVEHKVHDYDFTFVSGHFFSVTVDPRFDMIVFGEDKISVQLGERKSEGGKLLPAEDITIYARHLASHAHRERIVVEKTPEQKAEWEEIIAKVSKAVN